MSKKAMKVLVGILGLCVTMPIWYYLMYTILKAINASQLTWFLFWVYLPVSIFVLVVTKVLEAID